MLNFREDSDASSSKKRKVSLSRENEAIRTNGNSNQDTKQVSLSRENVNGNVSSKKRDFDSISSQDEGEAPSGKVSKVHKKITWP